MIVVYYFVEGRSCACDVDLSLALLVSCFSDFKHKNNCRRRNLHLLPNNVTNLIHDRSATNVLNCDSAKDRHGVQIERTIVQVQ